jgi:hypothetical protein
VRNLSLTEGADFPLIQRFSGARLDPGAQFLTVFLIGNAEYLHGLNLRVAEKEFFDLTRINILSTANDQVLWSEPRK